MAIAVAAVGVAFSVRISSSPDYREGLVAAHRPLPLNPLLAPDDPAVRDVGRLLYRGLLRLDDRALPVPDLASSVTPTSDGLAYSVTLPSSLRWSDGSALTVADVVATVSYVQSPGLASPGVATPWRGVRTSITGPDTVQFTLPTPRASFAAFLAEFPILPLGRLDPPSLFALPGRAAEPMATSGPYTVASTDATGLRLESNRHAVERPRLEHVELRLFPDFDAAARAMAIGSVDAVAGTTRAEEERLGSLPHVTLHRLLTFRFVDLVFNEHSPGLDDLAVRQAIGQAIDRARVVARAAGGAGEPQSRAIPAAVRWIGGGAPAPPDPAGARARLDAAGWAPGPDGVRSRAGIRLTYSLSVSDSSPLPDVAHAVAEQLAPLGVALTVQVVPSSAFVPAVITPRSFAVALADWDSGPDPDISSFWRSNATPPQGFNVSGAPTDPFLDRALDTLATETDPRAREDAAARVQSQLADAAPAVFLYAPADALALRDSITDAAIPAVGGSAARFATITSWGRGPSPGQGRDLLTLVMTAAGITVAVAAVGFTGARVAGRLLPAEAGSFVERTVVALVIDVVQVVGMLQVLGAIHLLWPIAVLVGHVLIAAIVVARIPAADRPDPAPRLLVRPWLPVIGAGAWFGALAAVQGVIAPSGERETRRTHIAHVAHWLSAHETWSLPFAAPGDAATAAGPGNTDLIALWTALPTHTDELAYLLNVVLAVIAVLAAAVIIRELGSSAWRGAMAGMLVVTAPLCLLTQTRSLLPDLTVTAGLLFAIAMILRGRHLASARVWAALAGLGLGLAAGSSAGAILPAAAVVVWALAVTPRHRLRSAGLLVTGLLALAGFWVVRNWVATGNPLAGVALPVGGAAGGGPEGGMSLAADVIQLRPLPLWRWVIAVWQLGGLGLMVLSAVVFPIGAVTLIRRRPATAMVAILVPILGLAYAASPGTGGGSDGDIALLAGGLRLGLAPLLLATVVAAAALSTRALVIVGAGVLMYNLTLALQAPTRADLALTPTVALATGAVAAAAAACALIAGGVIRRLDELRRWQVAVAATAVLIAIEAGAAALLHVTDDPAPTPLAGALAAAGRTGGLVVIVDDADVRSVLGSHLDVDIAAAGTGSPGQQEPITDRRALTARIEAMAPAAVVVGRDGVDPPPPGWRPPAAWRPVATLDGGARVYLP